jgi:antitoxin HigA-1
MAKIRIRTHPGVILHEEFLVPLEMSATALAKEIDVPANRITDLIRERRGMTADTAIRLGRYFATTPDLWLGLQTAHDLSKALAEGGKYAAIRPRHAA